MNEKRLDELATRKQRFDDLFKYIDVKSFEVNNLRNDVKMDERIQTTMKRESELLNALSSKDPIKAIKKLRPDYYGDRTFNPLELATELSIAYVRSFHDDGEPALLDYNQFSGTGTLNNRPIRVRGVSKKIFTILSNNVNKPIDTGFIWRAAGNRGLPTHKQDIIEINTYITNLRRSLGGISPSQLRLKNRTVELWAVQSLTDESDLKNLK